MWDLPTPPLELAGVNTSSPSERPLDPAAIGVPWGSPPGGLKSCLSTVTVAVLLPLRGLATVSTAKASVGAMGTALCPTEGVKSPLTDVKLIGTLHLVQLSAVAQRCERPRCPSPQPSAVVPG